jgi:FkbM family methyltransferase
MRLNLPDEARYWRGEHEPEVGRALLAAIQPGHVVYDVGAHLGYFALGVARVVGKSGRVIAFDGDPDNASRVRESVAKNDLGESVQVCHAAVWSRAEPDKIAFRRGIEPRAQGGVEADGCRPVLGNAELIAVPAITALNQDRCGRRRVRGLAGCRPALFAPAAAGSCRSPPCFSGSTDRPMAGRVSVLYKMEGERRPAPTSSLASRIRWAGLDAATELRNCFGSGLAHLCRWTKLHAWDSCIPKRSHASSPVAKPSYADSVRNQVSLTVIMSSAGTSR